MTQIHAPVALILGISGAIGGAVAEALAGRGYRIRALARSAPVGRHDRGPVEWIMGDAMNRADVVAAAADAAVIVHAVNPPGYAKWRELAIPMLANTIAAARTSGASIVFPANVYVYSPASGPVVDEATALTPATRKGLVRQEMEAMLAEAAADGVRTIAVRAGDFFGPGVTGSWFAQALAKGGRQAKVLHDLTEPGVGHAWAYVPDLAEAIARLVDRRDTLAPFEMVHFAGHWMDPGRTMVQATHRVIGRPDLPIRVFPWIILYLLAPFVVFLREAIEMRWLWRHSLRLDNAKLERLIGPEPHTTLDDAVARSLDRAAPSRPSPERHVALIGLLLLQTGLFLVPMIVLGQAIGWPASLRLPAAEVLPLIAREMVSVQIGYWAYLLTSLAFVPLAMAMRGYAHANGVKGVLVDTAAALGAAAGVLKMLGIVRWLVAMPALANLYGTTADPATRAAVEVGYVVLNGYAGAVGELLGVQLVSGVWLILTGAVLWRAGLRLAAGAALVIGALFVGTCARTLVPEAAVLQAVAVPLALCWFPVLAVSIWRRGSKTAGSLRA